MDEEQWSVGNYHGRIILLEIRALLGYYALESGNSVPMFRDKLSVPSSRDKKSFFDQTGDMRQTSLPCRVVRITYVLPLCISYILN